MAINSVFQERSPHAIRCSPLPSSLVGRFTGAWLFRSSRAKEDLLLFVFKT